MQLFWDLINFIQKNYAVKFNGYPKSIDEIIEFQDGKQRGLIHWIVFLGRVDCLRELLYNCHGDINIRSCNDENFSVLHFAAVNNKIDCLQLILDSKRMESIDILDVFGRSALSVASFYGRISAVVYLMSRGADINRVDIFGNSLLHLGVLSGNCDLVQVLLYSGLDSQLMNSLGETCLHLAVVKPNSKRLVKHLIQSCPSIINAKDKKGFAPLYYARLVDNKPIINLLTSFQAFLPKINTKNLIYATLTKSPTKFPIVFMVSVVFFWALPFYLRNVLFLTHSDYPKLTYISFVTFIAFISSLYLTNNISPGYLPRYTREYDHIICNLSNLSESQLIGQMSRLCHTCRTIKPMRASHCLICNRCVEHKDHHCPYLDTCIGFRNRQYFFSFLSSFLCGLIICFVYIYLLYTEYSYQFNILDYCGMFLALFSLGFVGLALLGTIKVMLYNLTTNEMSKWKSYGYEYLRTSNNNFYNQFNKGLFANILAYFRLEIDCRLSKQISVI